jgi:hypothetical protein
VKAHRALSPVFALCASLIIATLIGCGGGGGSSPIPPTPPPLAALVIATPTPLPTAVVNQPYSFTFQATGGATPYTWSTQATIQGLTLSTAGILSGAVTQPYPNSYVVTITVTDSKGTTTSKNIELDTVVPLSFSSASQLPDQNVALPVSAFIGVNGGKAPYFFSLTPGSTIPPGLNFANGNILGTPTVPGKYSFTVQVSDSYSPPFQISQAFTMNVLNNIVVPNSTLPDAVQNVPYSEQIKAYGGTPPYQFAVAPSSSLPPGLSLNPSTGVISGTPTTSTQYSVYINVSITDSASAPATALASISFAVQPPLSIQNSSLPDFPRGFAYNSNVNISGGRAPYALTVSSGTLPDGLGIANYSYPTYFNIFGVPTKNGTFQFTLKVSDSYEVPNTATQSFTVRISDPLSVTGPGSVNILYDQSYSATFPATGGIPPYTWSMSTIPPGFTFDSTTGTLSGTPTGASSMSPNVLVQDSSSPPQSDRYYLFALQVWGKLTILPSFLPPVAASSNVVFGLPTSGGASPMQWSVASGTLPPGLKFASSGDQGLLSGSPTTAGSYTFTLGLSDGNTGNLHQTTSQQYTLVVKPAAQMGRNDSPAGATPVSSLSLLASISPFSDPSTAGPDVDYYSASAAPGSIVSVYAAPNNDFVQPAEPNSLQPVIEVTDSTGTRYQTCGPYQSIPGQLYNLPCVNNFPGISTLMQGNNYNFQVPGTGTAPVTFYIRISDQRGDARPDFIYTLSLYGVN